MDRYSCEKCRWFFRIVNHKNKTVGRVCYLWADGYAGTADGYSPDESCFEPKNKKHNEW